MELVDKDTIINNIISVKNIDKELLESKTKNELVVIRYGKKMNDDIEKRQKYEDKLYDLDSVRFDRNILKSYNFEQINEFYNEFIINKNKRINLITNISEKSQLNFERLIKWSTKRLEDKLNNINMKERKETIMDDLRKYGDGITSLSTPTYIQKQRYNFLVSNGDEDNSKLRYIVSKKTSEILKKMNKRPLYKIIMTKNIEILEYELKILQKDNHQKKLIIYLLDYNYDIQFLKKQKIYVLEYLKSDLQPCEKGSRTELIRNLAAKNIWSRNTIRNWDIEKLKYAYIKNVQYSYGPLSEYISNKPLSKAEKERNKDKQHPRLDKSREEILKDIAETLFFDLVS